MTVIEITAEVGEDRQIHLPSNCPVGIHRFLIYVEDTPAPISNELTLGDPGLRQKNGVTVLNLPDQPASWLDMDEILNEIREERIRQPMRSGS